MANVKFYLKTPEADKSAIYVRFSIGKNNAGKYEFLKYYIDKSIDPKFWNNKTNRARESKDFPNYPEFNKRLKSIEDVVEGILLQFENEGITPTKEEIKQELDKVLKPNKIQFNKDTVNVKRMSFFEFVDYLIKTSVNKSSTVKSYGVVKKNLEDYEIIKKKKITFKNIDIDFYYSLVDYLTGLGLAKNTIGTRIKILKTFLSEANERDIVVNHDYQKKSFAKPKEETNAVYLNESELNQLYNLNGLPVYLERVRDIFLIGCYTGLRFSDLSRLKKEHITNDNKISITTQKTEQSVVVPLHPIVKQIFEKYNYELPHIPCNQKFNEYIKIVVKIAEINEHVLSQITKGGVVVSENTPKYDLVTSHTARRSFATNAFLADMPSISIMKITGHKTESSFMKYIKMSADDNANKMKEHKFFKQMLITK